MENVLIIYLLITWFVFLANIGEQMEFWRVIFWPILFIKYLVKGFILALLD